VGVSAHPDPGVSVHRFHIAGAAPGARLTLPDHAAHHAREVLRLRSGDPVHIFDGLGAEFSALLDEVSRRAVTARLREAVATRPESPLRVVLALSPLKGDRMELVIQKGTELGVAAFWPVITARTDAAARPALKGSRQQRWDKVASAAAEQCGRATVPLVVPTSTLDELLRRPFAGQRGLLLETGELPGLQSLGATKELLLLVGPPGGWEEGEAGRLRSAGFTAVSLGPRILRAETAAVAAVTLAQGLWGDLR
jgi:16S rRNA (uracil1498-N3)-methyltransferase